jgi:hypothetical protein
MLWEEVTLRKICTPLCPEGDTRSCPGREIQYLHHYFHFSSTDCMEGLPFASPAVLKGQARG